MTGKNPVRCCATLFIIVKLYPDCIRYTRQATRAHRLTKQPPLASTYTDHPRHSPIGLEPSSTRLVAAACAAGAHPHRAACTRMCSCPAICRPPTCRAVGPRLSCLPPPPAGMLPATYTATAWPAESSGLQAACMPSPTYSSSIYNACIHDCQQLVTHRGSGQQVLGYRDPGIPGEQQGEQPLITTIMYQHQPTSSMYISIYPYVNTLRLLCTPLLSAVLDP